MFWVILALMCLAAVGFTIWPLTRDLQKQGLLTGFAIVFVVGLSAALYAVTGRPGVPSGASEPVAASAAGSNPPEVEAMVAGLAARLEQEPGDVDGWMMLGRSYMTLGNADGAVSAYERAVELTSSQDADALIGLGEALMSSSGQTMTPRSISLFESALALAPNNPTALFWGGIGAFNRGDSALAADRWELLLGTNPPPEIRGVIEQRIALWRGETAQQPVQPRPAPAAQASQAVVAASISVNGDAAAALPAEATVFVIARDPAAPSPPIAVTRRLLSELPAVIELGDGDSMIPGRELSNFAEFELVARVSLSGSPAAQAGDWFGTTLVRPAEGNAVDLAISQKVE